MITIILAVLLGLAVAALIQQKRYRDRMVAESSELLRVQAGESNELRRLFEETNDAGLRQNKKLHLAEREIINLKARNEAAYNAAAYDREQREEAERLVALKDGIIEKHAKHCDSILEDVVEGMMADIRPKEASE